MKELYSISPSLLNSWTYIYKAFDKYEDQALMQFIVSLCRIKDENELSKVIPSLPNSIAKLFRLNKVNFGISEAMQKGIDFENVVNEIVATKRYPSCVNMLHIGISEIVMNGIPQVELKKKIKIDGVNLLLVGYADYIKEGVIYDIKTTKKYEAGKYYDNFQHACYLYMCPQANKFEYLVSDGKDMYREQYAKEASEFAEQEISEFITFLKQMDLWELFKEHRRVN